MMRPVGVKYSHRVSASDFHRIVRAWRRTKLPMFSQHKMAHFIAVAGEIASLDRIRWNRAGVTRVMGVLSDSRSRLPTTCRSVQGWRARRMAVYETRLPTPRLAVFGRIWMTVATRNAGAHGAAAIVRIRLDPVVHRGERAWPVMAMTSRAKSSPSNGRSPRNHAALR